MCGSGQGGWERRLEGRNGSKGCKGEHPMVGISLGTSHWAMVDG